MALLAGVSALAMVAFAQGDHVPAYNTAPPKPGEVMPILPPDQRVGELFKNPYQVRAYAAGGQDSRRASISSRAIATANASGTRACTPAIESDHGAHCGICMKEVFYAYEQTKLGKTPAQIRAGIIKGEWKSIDLDEAAKVD